MMMVVIKSNRCALKSLLVSEEGEKEFISNVHDDISKELEKLVGGMRFIELHCLAEMTQSVVSSLK